MSGIEAIFWDYGDTLEDHGAIHWPTIIRQYLKNFGHLLTRRTGQQADPARMVAEYARVHRQVEERARLTSAETPACAMVRQLVPAACAPLSDDQLDELIIEALFQAPAFPVFADVIDTLERLRERGLKQVIVSNAVWSEAFLRQNLARQQLERYFDEVISSARVGLRKPHPRIYALALKQAGVSPETAVFVGDNLVCDVEGPQAAGMRGVWKRNHRQAEPIAIEPDAIIDDAGELPAVLERWS